MTARWESLARVLGGLPEARRGTIVDLNETSNATVDELRAVARQHGRMVAHDYLSYLTADRDWELLANFLEDVVARGQEPAAWRVESAFVYLDRRDARALAATNLADAERELGPSSWCQCVPTARDLGSAAAGAPGVTIGSVRYRARPARGVSWLRFGANSTSPILSEVSDHAVALARWMALRFATLVDATALGSESTLLTALALDAADLGDLARAAIRGLLREERECGPWTPAALPGFRGPDDWFA